MLLGWEATRYREKLPWWARGSGSRVCRTHGLRCPTAEPLSRFSGMVPARPVSGPALPTPQAPKQPSKPPWQCPNLRNQTQYKPLLGGILLSPFNRLEVFYILRKTTFELGVLFSGLCFVFALIKFPLTQISIKCGSHQRRTLATPCLLFSERRTCLCYGNVSREWANSGKPAPATTHPFSPCLSAPFQAPRHEGKEESYLGREFCFYWTHTPSHFPTSTWMVVLWSG